MVKFIFYHQEAFILFLGTQHLLLFLIFVVHACLEHLSGLLVLETPLVYQFFFVLLQHLALVLLLLQKVGSTHLGGTHLRLLRRVIKRIVVLALLAIDRSLLNFKSF